MIADLQRVAAAYHKKADERYTNIVDTMERRGVRCVFETEELPPRLQNKLQHSGFTITEKRIGWDHRWWVVCANINE